MTPYADELGLTATGYLTLAAVCLLTAALIVMGARLDDARAEVRAAGVEVDQARAWAIASDNLAHNALLLWEREANRETRCVGLPDRASVVWGTP